MVGLREFCSSSRCYIAPALPWLCNQEQTSANSQSFPATKIRGPIPSRNRKPPLSASKSSEKHPRIYNNQVEPSSNPALHTSFWDLTLKLAGLAILAVSTKPQRQFRRCLGFRSSHGTDCDISEIASPELMHGTCQKLGTSPSPNLNPA